MKYAELDGVIYRAKDGYFYGGKLVGGKWKANWDAAKVHSFGNPISEAEARELAGDEWPEAEAA